MSKPSVKPNNPNFSSGPTSKRPNWSLNALSDAALGRSHRSSIGKKKLKEVIEKQKALLQLPEGYHLGVVPASDTGAVEMAMWSMLGCKPTTVLAWESFGSAWVTDAAKQLKLDNLETVVADYGVLPNFAEVDTKTRDIVFTLNGTTSGVKCPNLDWIANDREGITICDATSGVLAQDIDWSKIDVLTYSWQKVMGSEAAHGILILSPRAVERLESYAPDRPLPKIFRLTKGGKLNASIFEGSTINTPSMLCVEDALDFCNWAESEGGLQGLIKRSTANLKAVEDFVADNSDWLGFLAENENERSTTSICLKITDDWYTNLPVEEQQAKAKQIVKALDAEGVAYDIGAYRDAPAGLRIWGGATVETSDIEALMPWIKWAFEEIKAEAESKAA